MFKNYFQLAIRNLRKNKFYSILNILGLAVGMAGFLLIAQYIFFETSYDEFHEQGDDIYRVQLNQYKNNELTLASAENYPGTGPALQSEFPEVLDYTRLYNMGYKNNVIISYDDAPNGPLKFKMDKFLYADSSFFQMFSFPLLSGDPHTVLSEPNTAVISETYARKFFGDADPVGKLLHLQDDDFNNETSVITGVFKDVPENSHLRFDLLFSYKTLYRRGTWAPKRYDLTWDRKDFYTYIRLRKGTNPDVLAAKFPAIIDKYSPQLAARQRRDEFILQPLQDIHLHSDLVEEAEVNGNAQVIFFLAIIACFILIIAWINYVNLSTAKAMDRAREVGVRKTLGALRNHLTLQFMLEALMVNLLAVLIAGILMSLLLPLFNELTELHFSVGKFWGDLGYWGLVVGLVSLGTILSGLYPALVLASYKPTRVLKGAISTSRHGLRLRQALVVLQFTAAIVLISGTVIVYQQIEFMLGQDLGFDIEHTLVLERPSIRPRNNDDQKHQVDLFKNELLRDPAIQRVSGVNQVPGNSRTFQFLVRQYGAPEEEAHMIRINSVDYDYFEMFSIDILAGRSFSEKFASDFDSALVITENASRLLGFNKPDDAVGEGLTISIGSSNYHMKVIGVINNFHQASLKEAVEPFVMTLAGFESEYYTLKVSSNNLHQTIDYVKTVWDRVFPGNPMHYFFLDDYFNQQYQSEQRFSKLIRVFALLALFISGLGLLGLSAFTMQQRTKEIGVRKVLGASEVSIFLLLSRDFTKLVVIAIVLGIPVTYVTMDNWLNSYVSRINLGAGIFILVGVFTLLVAWMTISWQSVKAAFINPVNSFRSE